MSTVDKLNKVIKNCQIIFDLLKIPRFVTYMCEYYMLRFSVSIGWLLSIHTGKKMHIMFFEKAFFGNWFLQRCQVLLEFWDTQDIIKEKKFSWTTSGGAVLVPALSQSRADFEVRRPCLVELWISLRWHAPVLSHSLGNFSSPLCAVEISHVLTCISCTLLFHSMPLRIGFVFLNHLQVVGMGGGEWVPPLACSSGWTNLTDKMMLSVSPMTWASAPKAS